MRDDIAQTVQSTQEKRSNNVSNIWLATYAAGECPRVLDLAAVGVGRGVVRLRLPRLGRRQHRLRIDGGRMKCAREPVDLLDQELIDEELASARDLDDVRAAARVTCAAGCPEIRGHGRRRSQVDVGRPVLGQADAVVQQLAAAAGATDTSTPDSGSEAWGLPPVSAEPDGYEPQDWEPPGPAGRLRLN